MRTTLTLAVTGLAAASPAMAASLDISVEVPRLNVAEYHRPYVALWIEDSNGTHQRNLSVCTSRPPTPKATAPSGCRTCASGGARAAAP